MLTRGIIKRMDKAKRLRGATWIAFLLKHGEFKSLADLHRKLDVVGDSQLWSAYNTGVKSPQQTTVKLVDRVVPGSADVFNGPPGLPVWDLIEGDVPLGQQIVTDLLTAYLQPERWMSLARSPLVSMGDSERLKALLEIVLPVSVWKGSTVYNPNAINKIDLIGWLSLPELFELPENPLVLSYTTDRLKSIQDKVIKSFVSHETEIHKNISDKYGIDTDKRAFVYHPDNNLSNPLYVLAFVAFIQICNESKDKTLSHAPQFLKVGIRQATIDLFGTDIAQLIMNL